MPRSTGFAPLARRDATILILGSMPGQASLRAGRYYAHPRNCFWSIVCQLIGSDPALPYARRAKALKSARIALWDVLFACKREGSLDSDIDEASIEPNDFAALFRRCPLIRQVYFNGAKAEQCFRRHVLPALPVDDLRFVRLPSTSPANASWSYARRLAAWRVIVHPAAAAARAPR